MLQGYRGVRKLLADLLLMKIFLVCILFIYNSSSKSCVCLKNCIVIVYNVILKDH